jgi:hypothetical protein
MVKSGDFFGKNFIPGPDQAFFPEALPGKMYVKVLDTQCS